MEYVYQITNEPLYLAVLAAIDPENVTLSSRDRDDDKVIEKKIDINGQEIFYDVYAYNLQLNKVYEVNYDQTVYIDIEKLAPGYEFMMTYIFKILEDVGWLPPTLVWENSILDHVAILQQYNCIKGPFAISPGVL
jgi:hypothetical protein